MNIWCVGRIFSSFRDAPTDCEILNKQKVKKYLYYYHFMISILINIFIIKSDIVNTYVFNCSD